MYRKKLLLLIIIATVIRLLTAAILELGNDEVYYYTYGLHLQQNYFDHPPGVAILIKLFTLNLTFKSEVFVRLGSVVCAALGTIISFYIGKKIRNERTGWFAAVLYNTSIYAGIISGIFILPDSPQIIFWLASLWLLLTIISNSNKSQKQFINWVLFGIAAGLCIMCKVHGGFLWISLGLYIIFYDRKLFLQPGLYIAAIISAVIISPIYFWNAANNFITWRYHSERVEVQQFSLDTDGFIQTFVGQIFYNNPVNVLLIFIAAFAYKKHSYLDKPVYRLLALCGWPIIIFTTLLSLFRTALPHWSGPGFVSLGFIAAAFADYKLQQKPTAAVKVYIKTAVGLITFLIVAGVAVIEFYPGTIGKKDKEHYGDGDFTLDMYGWRSFGSQFVEWNKDAVDKGLLDKEIKIVCDKWFPAAHLDYYVARRIQKHVIGTGNLTDLHQYAWLNTLRGGIAVGESALCVIPSNYFENVEDTYGKYFDEVVFLKEFTVLRSRSPARYFNVFILKKFRGNDELFGRKFN